MCYRLVICKRTVAWHARLSGGGGEVGARAPLDSILSDLGEYDAGEFVNRARACDLAHLQTTRSTGETLPA
jgi:hypothetical protein